MMNPGEGREVEIWMRGKLQDKNIIRYKKPIIYVTFNKQILACISVVYSLMEFTASL